MTRKSICRLLPLPCLLALPHRRYFTPLALAPSVGSLPVVLLRSTTG
jgi:hypothetical protein